MAAPTHVDHAGAPPPLPALVREHLDALTAGPLLGNPHSSHAPGHAAAAAAAAARSAVLAHFGVSDATHAVAFTASATHALKLVGELFPWTAAGAVLVHHRRLHSSALGIREYAHRAGARVVPLPDDSFALVEAAGPALYVLPAQCNFAGTRFPFADWIARIGGRGRVLLDAAAWVATNPLDLGACPADFVALSFYKMLGYPTGLGALVVRNDALAELASQKAYFGGGTVLSSLPAARYHKLRPGVAALEDGTLNYQAIAAVPLVLAHLARLGPMEAIAERVAGYRDALCNALLALRHWNGAPVCVCYGRDRPCGGTLAVNFLRPDGSFVGYSAVEQLAALADVYVRSGCMCNPGACHAHLGITEDEARAQFAAGKVCWDDQDVIDGKPTGAVRFSFGASSTADDVRACIAFVSRALVCADGPQVPRPLSPAGGDDDVPTIGRILVYPIKSCGAFEPQHWRLGPRGLVWDREFALVDPAGAALTQKRAPRLTQVRPRIDLTAGEMVVQAPGEPDLCVPLGPGFADGGLTRVCGRRQESTPVADASQWFSRVVGRECRLVRVRPDATQSFANDSHLLVLSQASVDDINARLPAGSDAVDAHRFRPNLVIDGALAPYAEDAWGRIDVGGSGATLAITGRCARCIMVTIDQDTGKSCADPMTTLAAYRRDGSQVYLGVHAAIRSEGDGELHAGMKALPK